MIPTPAPWRSPELTSLGRLPMHALARTRPAHRLELDGTWRFQLLPRPDAEPSAAWRDVAVPGCWTMQGVGDLAHYTNVVMPFAGRPPRRSST